MSLPEELHLLVKTLDEMRITLLLKYREYEEKFDGSHILGVVPDLIKYLQDLVEAAKAIEIKPLRVSPTIERSDMLIGMQEDKGDAFKGGKVETGSVGTGLRKRGRGDSLYINGDIRPAAGHFTVYFVAHPCPLYRGANVQKNLSTSSL